VIREITPAKEWSWALTAYAVGLVGGTTTIGSVLGWMGTLLQNAGIVSIQNPFWMAFVALVALLLGLRELGVVTIPVPQTGWLVPAVWSRYGKVVQAFLYGMVLGLEVFTFVPFATAYIIMLLQMSAGISGGALIGFAYGVARVGPSIGSAIFAKMGQQDVDEIAVKILSGAPYLHILNGFVLLVTGEIFIVNVLLALNQ
jgi:hypothetical protein